MSHNKTIQYIEVDVPPVDVTAFYKAQANVAIDGWTIGVGATGQTAVGIEDPDLPSGKGMVVNHTSGGSTTILYWAKPSTTTDTSAICLLKNTQSVVPGIWLRANDGTGGMTGYLLRITATDLVLFRFNAGTGTTLDTLSFPVAIGDLIWLRFDAVDTGAQSVLLRGKAWSGEIQDEPEDWMISYTDEAVLTAPTVTSITQTSSNTFSTTHNVSMPATVNAGDLLLCLLSGGNSAPTTVTTPSGWTQLRDLQPALNINFLYIAAKVAVGDEDGTTVNFATSNNNDFAAQVYRIANTEWFGTLAGIEVSTGLNQTSATTTPNPDSLAASWGELETLYIAACTFDRDTFSETVSSYPSGYSSGTTTQAAGWEANIATAVRAVSTASEDPGSFTISASQEWSAVTIGIRPAAGAFDGIIDPGYNGLLLSSSADYTYECGFFQVKSLDTEETFRFAIPTDYLDRSIDAIPNVASISFKPAVISLGENLGERSNLTVTFKDHRHTLGDEPFEQGTFWGKWRARYGQKLRGRKVHWRNGLEGQSVDEMPTRHFFVDSVDGPTPDGSYTITAKDLLKFADDVRSQAPILSNGVLAGGANSSVTSLSLSPTGIGNAEYPSSGYICLGGKEVVSFTRTADALTVTRAQFNTTGIAHDAGVRAQLVLNYSGNDVSEIIQDLLVNYAGVASAYIPISEWQTETGDNLGVIYARAITEPTPVNKLLSELIEQAGLALWWDELAQVVRFQVLKPIATDTATFDEDVILQNSLKIKDQPDKRISQIWTYYSQRNPADRGDDEDNYRNALAEVDLERETDYGNQPVIRKVIGKWIATENAAQRLNQIQISRFRDPPRKFNFDLFPGTSVLAGSGYRLNWRQLQNVLGNVFEAGAPIQITRVAVEAGVIRVEAEEMLASGTVVLTSVVILTTTGALLDWTIPDDWNDDDNSIHSIGAGGGGGSGTGAGGGGGGGGGAYSSISNLALAAVSPPTVQYRVGSAGVGSSGLAGTVGSDTWFNGATLAASSVGAKGGQGGTTGNVRTSVNGGQTVDGIGTLKTSGGLGGRGAPKGTTRAGGGGGGGAGGPNGNGADGGEISSSNNDGGAGGGAADGGSSDGTYDNDNGSNGGNNRFNFGGGTSGQINGDDGGGGKGGISRSVGTTGNGGAGEALWTQTIAPIINAGPGGGGGGGGSHDDPGGNGGLYGGGGGGGGGDASQRGGHAAQGVIVIVYKPV